MQRFRNAASKTWLGAVFAICLRSPSRSHSRTSFDNTAAHDNGQVCAVCVGAASFRAGAVAVPFHFEPVIAAATVVIAVLVALSSAIPTRRYARGPQPFPSESSTLGSCARHVRHGFASMKDFGHDISISRAGRPLALSAIGCALGFGAQRRPRGYRRDHRHRRAARSRRG